jgi:type IV pilus assembly protein PilW
MGHFMAGKRKYLDDQGFTLVELLLSMGIAAVVMASIYAVYLSQQKSFTTQEKVATMHQNVRAAMYYMERDIRMAGCNPTGIAGAGIITANPSLIRFTEDIRGQGDTDPSDGDTGDPNEDITYSLADGDGDGDTDLVRDTRAGEDIADRIIAENIVSLNFTYLDADGNTTASLSAIRFVQVSLTAATEDNENDSVLTTRINCRNLGI